MIRNTITRPNNTASKRSTTAIWIITAIVGIIFGVLYFLQPDTNDEC